MRIRLARHRSRRERFTGTRQAALTRPTPDYMRPACQTEKGNAPPRHRCPGGASHGRVRRGIARPRPYYAERPGAPLWPKGRPCADGSGREESRKTRSPPSFRRGKTRPAALTQPPICVPTGKTRRGHAGRVADAEGKDTPAALTIAPPRPCFKTLRATFTRSPAMRRAGVPLWDAGPDVVLSVILQDGDHPRPIRHMRPRRRAWRRPSGRRQGELPPARHAGRESDPHPWFWRP